jgi:putative DNA primase/helicase
MEPAPIMMAEALNLARRGYRVFPIYEPTVVGGAATCACRDIKCKAIGKHPRTKHGVNDATVDEAQIRRWWMHWPTANIGVATGSGLHVLDVDGPDGAETLRARYGLEIAEFILTTLTASTGRDGGYHLFFNAPAGPSLKSVAGRLGQNLDERGEPGYVVAAPSLHKSGARYAWTTGLDRPRAPWPDAFLGMPEGERSTTLLRYIGWWFHVGLGDDEVLVHARDHNTRFGQPPLDDSEVEQLVRNVGERHRKSGSINLAAVYSDAGNGARLATAVHGELKVCLPLGTAFVFNTRFWEPDVREQPLARTVAKRFVDKELHAAALALAAGTREHADEHVKEVLKLKNESRFTSMLKNAKDDPILRVEPQAFDRPLHLINVADGTLNLDTLALQPFAADDLLTGQLPVAYVPGARSEVWAQHIRYLASASDGTPRPDLEAFYWRALGYTLYGGNAERRAFFLKGRTTAGKTKLLEGVRALFGRYAGSLGFDSLLKKGRFNTGGDGARSDIAGLLGKRFVTAAEPNVDGEFDTALLKQLTGGDTLMARHLYQRATPFIFTGKLWLAANAPPKIASDDDATWMRLLVIPVEYTLPTGLRDDGILHKLTTAEALTGLLAMMIDGLQEVRTLGGLQPPTIVTGATNAYRDDNNALTQFLADACMITEPRRKTAGVPKTRIADVFERYTRYCETRDVPPLFQTTRSFAEALRDLSPGFEVTKSTGGGTFVYGLELAARMPEVDDVDTIV